MAATNISSPATGARNPYLRANSLNELLAWHDVDFIRCAYVTILGRQPDPQGEAYYSDRIRRGHSKLEVIGQLRTSPEGPRHDPGIAGLDRALKRSRWERNHLVGAIVRLFTRGEGDGPQWRLLRSTANKLATMENREASLAEEDHARLLRVDEKTDRMLEILANLDETLIGGRPPNGLSAPAKDVFLRLSASSALGAGRN